MLRSDRVRSLRASKQFTLEVLSTQLNMSMRQLTRYEAEDVDASVGIVSRMADLFNVSVDYLVGRTDDPNPYLSDHDFTADELTIIRAVRAKDALTAIKIIIKES